MRADRTRPLLFLAGPGEFHASGGPNLNATDNAFSSPKSLEIFASVLFGLGYDLGVLSPGEADSLTARTTAWPPNFLVARELTERVLPLADGRKVGVLVLPPLPQGQEAPTAGVVSALADRAESLRQQCGLVIGISPWGYLAESAYVTRFPAAVDILLGAGPGPGTDQTAAGGKVLWLRGYTRGKTVQTVTVKAWPGQRRDFTWPKDGFEMDNQGLDDSKPSDPGVNDRLAGINP